MYYEQPHETRWFACGWAPRKEGVLKVASRVRAMAAEVEKIEPSLDPLWPQFKPRRLRPGDPGPITALSDEELAHLIDTRARADPPPLPAPVGPAGYSFALGGRPEDRGVLWGANIWAETNLYAREEPVRLDLGNESSVWRDAEKAQRILFALVDAWSADWAAAVAFVHLGIREDGESVAEMRPWMAWAAQEHQVPASWIRDGGEPMDVRPEHDGRLSTWLWPPKFERPIEG